MPLENINATTTSLETIGREVVIEEFDFREFDHVFERRLMIEPSTSSGAYDKDTIQRVLQDTRREIIDRQRMVDNQNRSRSNEIGGITGDHDYVKSLETFPKNSEVSTMSEQTVSFDLRVDKKKFVSKFHC